MTSSPQPWAPRYSTSIPSKRRSASRRRTSAGAYGTRESAALEWVVPPVHQRVAPARVLLVAVGPALRQMAARVTDDLAHVLIVGFGQLVLRLALDRDDLAPRLVPDGLAVIAAPANRARLIRRA